MYYQDKIGNYVELKSKEAVSQLFSVRRYIHQHTGELVLIKKIKLISYSDASILSKDIQFQKNLKHRSLLPILNHFIKHNSIYIVCQNAKTFSKEQVQSNSSQRIFTIFKEIVSAYSSLKKISKRKRQFSFKNIFFGESGVKVLDLGQQDKGLFSENITNKVLMESDVWSLGLLLYQIFIINPLTQKHNYQTMLLKIQEKSKNHLLKDLVFLIKSMLEPNPKHRCTWKMICNILHDEKDTSTKQLIHPSIRPSSKRSNSRQIISPRNQLNSRVMNSGIFRNDSLIMSINKKNRIYHNCRSQRQNSIQSSQRYDPRQIKIKNFIDPRSASVRNLVYNQRINHLNKLQNSNKSFTRKQSLTKYNKPIKKDFYDRIKSINGTRFKQSRLTNNSIQHFGKISNVVSYTPQQQSPRITLNGNQISGEELEIFCKQFVGEKQKQATDNSRSNNVCDKRIQSNRLNISEILNNSESDLIKRKINNQEKKRRENNFRNYEVQEMRMSESVYKTGSEKYKDQVQQIYLQKKQQQRKGVKNNNIVIKKTKNQFIKKQSNNKVQDSKDNNILVEDLSDKKIQRKNINNKEKRLKKNRNQNKNQKQQDNKNDQKRRKGLNGEQRNKQRRDIMQQKQCNFQQHKMEQTHFVQRFDEFIKKYNILCEALKFAKTKLLDQMSCWLIPCFYIYKSYFLIRKLILQNLRANSKNLCKNLPKLKNNQTIYKYTSKIEQQNKTIKAGLQNLINLIKKKAKSLQIFDKYYPQSENKVHLKSVSNFRSQYLSTLNEHFNHFFQIIEQCKQQFISDGTIHTLCEYIYIISQCIHLIKQPISMDVKQYFCIKKYRETIVTLENKRTLPVKLQDILKIQKRVLEQI